MNTCSSEKAEKLNLCNSSLPFMDKPARKFEEVRIAFEKVNEAFRKLADNTRDFNLKTNYRKYTQGSKYHK